MAILCENCKQQVATDSSIPVTEEWLRDEWGFTGGDGYAEIVVHSIGGGPFITLSFIEYMGCDAWRIYTEKQEIYMPHTITTRYQFRLLAAALGIKQKGE